MTTGSTYTNKKEVESRVFPGPEHSFKMPDEALAALKKLIEE